MFERERESDPHRAVDWLHEAAVAGNQRNRDFSPIGHGNSPYRKHLTVDPSTQHVGVTNGSFGTRDGRKRWSRSSCLMVTCAWKMLTRFMPSTPPKALNSREGLPTCHGVRASLWRRIATAVCCPSQRTYTCHLSSASTKGTGQTGRTSTLALGGRMRANGTLTAADRA